MIVAREETIVARATPRGASALSIVRLSGENAIKIAASVFEGQDLNRVASHTAHVGFLRNQRGDSVDQVVATIFVSPGTATGEDIVELTCHGGDVASDEAVRLFLGAGARMASPGEFTLRAFLNGKIDLAQAEAIGELIHARSSRASRISMAHLRGEYSAGLSVIRKGLLELIALIELELDFSEEDVEFADRNRLVALLETATMRIKELLGSYRLGSAITKGIRVVIAGRPNAGKSTFLNALLGYDRAIVSDVPGTTRDEIESEIEYEGFRIQFVDTAGLRDTSNEIEAEGVRRSHAALASADLLLYIIDMADSSIKKSVRLLESVRAENPDLAILSIGNKIDLLKERPLAAKMDCMISAVSLARDESGLKKMIDLVLARTVGDYGFAGEQQIVTSQRHRFHLEKALKAAERAREQLHANASGDMLSSDVRAVIGEIGSITGEVTNEDILTEIFSSFCIGK